mgnify:CR=1 FL=1
MSYVAYEYYEYYEREEEMNCKVSLRCVMPK